MNDSRLLFNSRDLHWPVDDFSKRYLEIRNETERLSAPLVVEDYVVQTMPEVSPAKWHLAHTSWFFETFILREFVPGYRDFHPQYNYLFNSYYVQVGQRFSRPQRGLLSRPTVAEIYEYRAHVDQQMQRFFNQADEDLLRRASLFLHVGFHHEQQHQELLLTDIKNVLAANPLHPVYNETGLTDIPPAPPLDWITLDGGLFQIGTDGSGFYFDNESPRHQRWLEGYQLASRPVTNAEFLEFMADGGYGNPELWLSDGFACADQAGWNAPLYWRQRDGEWWQFTLNGFRPVNPAEPVTHVSFYEAEAFARWAQARLPTEAEWERAVNGLPVQGNFVENRMFHPAPMQSDPLPGGLNQMYGDVWEWTRSDYSPYPGFKVLPGAIGEYNGKFMSGQMVLRGGSCATSRTHIRSTYRNFFHPHLRWQFMGFRLARDV